MKIIKNNWNDPIKNSTEYKPKEFNVVCEYCDSELIVEEDDLYVGTLGLKFAKCPCCKREISADIFGAIELTENILSFPKHYFYFGENAIKISDDDIDAEVKEMIEQLRKTRQHYTYRQRGDTFILVVAEEDEFFVKVCKNSYETYVPIETE